MATPRGRPEATVRPQALDRAFTVERIPPSAELAGFVEYHWLVRWAVEEPHTQQVVPQPRVHVVAEDGRLLVHGVARRLFERPPTSARSPRERPSAGPAVTAAQRSRMMAVR